VLRSQLSEVHFITHVGNLQSILKLGILSYNQMEAAGIAHISLADPGIQQNRTNILVPPWPGTPLHDYANLYVNGRNSMLSRILFTNPPQNVAVIGVSTDQLLDLPGVVITSQNAASSGRRWLKSPDGLAELEREVVFAQYWTNHPTAKERSQHEQVMCAEVLVPNSVEPVHVARIHVSCQETLTACVALDGAPAVQVSPYLFFGKSHS